MKAVDSCVPGWSVKRREIRFRIVISMIIVIIGYHNQIVFEINAMDRLYPSPGAGRVGGEGGDVWFLWAFNQTRGE